MTSKQDVSWGFEQSAEHWFALKVRVRSEPFSAAELEKRGFTVYAPFRTEHRQYSDRVRKAVTAVFPGYIFCRFAPGERVKVLESPGVQQVVGIGGAPTPITPEEIGRVQQVLACGGYPAPYVQVGDRIRIIKGPLIGVEGILLRSDDDHKLLVSIDMLQRAVAVEIGRDEMEPAEPRRLAYGAGLLVRSDRRNA